MTLLDDVDVACFDLFDTLVRIDTARLPAVRWGAEELRSTIPVVHEEVFAERGVPLERLVDAIRSIWSKVRRELDADEGDEDRRWAEIPAVEKYRRMLAEMRVGDDAEIAGLAERVADVHHATLVSAARAVPGAVEVLERVRARGLRTALVSNWDHARAGPAMLRQTGLEGLLDHLVISEAVGVRKPHRRIFESALAPFGAAPGRALHVGDLARGDAWGATRLGMRAVWINPRGKAWSEPGPPPTLTLPALEDLLAHV